jgi:hypothetical protein
MGITMPDGSFDGQQLIQTNAVEGPVKFTTVQNTPNLPLVIKYQCFQSVIQMPTKHICQGDNTVKVCAKSQRDADIWTNSFALPALAAVTTATCERAGKETCRLLDDGSFSGLDKDKCCRVRGVNQLAMCASDQDCLVSTGLGHYSLSQTLVENAESGTARQLEMVMVPRVPLGKGDTPGIHVEPTAQAGITEQCCGYCEAVLGSKGNSQLLPPRNPYCNGADKQKARQICQDMGCKSTSPGNPNGCLGFSFGFAELDVVREIGGSVSTPEGAGLDIPRLVWPENAGPASVSIVKNVPPPPGGGVAAGAAVFFSPSGIVFPEPGVTLKLPFDDSAVSQDTKAGLADGSMQTKVFRIVNGVLTTHPFPPEFVVDPLTGLKSMSVKSLGFSAYMVVIVPVETATTAPPSSSTTAPPSTPPPVPQLRPETLTIGPTPAPVQESTISIALIVGVAIGGFIFLSLSCAGVYLYRSQDQRRGGSKSKQLQGTLTESLLSGGAVVSASDSSATQSEDATPPGSMQLTKIQQTYLRPKAFEIMPSLVVQGELVMADGSYPPSYAASEIDRDDIEASFFEGSHSVYPKTNRPVLETDFVTVQADLVLINKNDDVDPLDSPAPSYTPSMADDDTDEDEFGSPGKVSARLAETLKSNLAAPPRPHLGAPPVSISFAPDRPNMTALSASRPNINAGSVQNQDDLMGQDFESRPRMSLDVRAQDDII